MSLILDGSNGITAGSSQLSNTELSYLDGVTSNIQMQLDSKASSASAYRMVRGTAVTASGTYIDFTGIPSWAKRITIMFNGVSTSGAASVPMVQLGISSGVENTGYSCAAWNGEGAATSITSGFHIVNSWDIAITVNGQMIINTFGGNSWVESSVCSTSNNYFLFSAGKKTLSGTLDRIRITTVNGTDTFDAGSINIIWEG